MCFLSVYNLREGFCPEYASKEPPPLSLYYSHFGCKLQYWSIRLLRYYKAGEKKSIISFFKAWYFMQLKNKKISIFLS